MQSSYRALCCTCAVLVTTISPAPALAQQFSDWSAPVNLGSTVNSATSDFFPFVSRDGLSLYLTSPCWRDPLRICSPAFSWDILVSQRSTVDDLWSSPQFLGPAINSPLSFEGSPALSPDGHLMFFSSTRSDGLGGNDIYVSRRHNKRDDHGWQPPENLGNGVNSGANDANPEFFEDETTGAITLYFDSNRPGGPGPFTNEPGSNGNDIYISTLQPDETFADAALVAELSSPYADRQPTIRRDGLEIIFSSNRPGGYGGLDVWVATRASTSDPWSTPVNLGPLVNSPGNESGPMLSFDRTNLYFNSDRPGGYGGYDLYVITRTKLRH